MNGGSARALAVIRDHLAEHERVAAARHDVDLALARAVVALEHAVAAALESLCGKPLTELSDSPSSIARHAFERRWRRATCLTTTVTISSRLSGDG
jgi:hypothetical protein